MIMIAVFIFLGVWWFLDEYLPGVNLMDGQYVWILRIVSAFMLGASIIINRDIAKEVSKKQDAK